MIHLLSAPTNLGLRPPQPGSVPGCSKAPEAYREAGLHARLLEHGATDTGVVLPGRYVDDAAPGTGRLRNQDGITAHAQRLATRIGQALQAGDAPLVLGGDCSLLIGAGIALKRRGRYGLAHLDGHTDYRHPGNSPDCASLAGEDLAAAIGQHWPTISDIGHLAPYFQAADTIHIGCRDDDEHLPETRQTLAAVLPASQLIAEGADPAAEHALRVLHRPALAGFWLHLDVDILDPTHLPAVDSPNPGGIDPDTLLHLLRRLAPTAAGAEVTVFDPDLDPDGHYAQLLVDVLADGLADLGSQSR